MLSEAAEMARWKSHVGNGTCGERGDDDAGQKSQSKELTLSESQSKELTLFAQTT
jgi:hypothetical protein